MVNPDSDLYRAHPDWVINFPGRPRSEARNQLVLNLAREDVREHLFQTFDKLFSENNIEYVKWDMNRDFSETGWPEAPLASQRTLWIRYVNNLYNLYDRLRERHPKVFFETCSGGGGRIDLGILARSEQVWTSDNTDPLDRLKLQYGFTLPYPPKIMMSWVTEVPDPHNQRTTPLKYRFLVSMMGSLGLSVALEKWPQADLDYARKMIDLYKEIRETVQHGDLYRLASPFDGEVSATQYVSADSRQSLLFAFRHSQQFKQPLAPIRLRGLDPSANYRIRTIDDKLAGGARTVSGAYLGAHGLTLRLTSDFDSTLIVLERTD
jgi:alpha-galactosidase